MAYNYLITGSLSTSRETSPPKPLDWAINTLFHTTNETRSRSTGQPMEIQTSATTARAKTTSWVTVLYAYRRSVPSVRLLVIFGLNIIVFRREISKLLRVSNLRENSQSLHLVVLFSLSLSFHLTWGTQLSLLLLPSLSKTPGAVASSSSHMAPSSVPSFHCISIRGC